MLIKVGLKSNYRSLVSLVFVDPLINFISMSKSLVCSDEGLRRAASCLGPAMQRASELGLIEFRGYEAHIAREQFVF